MANYTRFTNLEVTGDLKTSGGGGGGGVAFADVKKEGNAVYIDATFAELCEMAAKGVVMLRYIESGDPADTTASFTVACDTITKMQYTPNSWRYIQTNPSGTLASLCGYSMFTASGMDNKPYGFSES